MIFICNKCKFRYASDQYDCCPFCGGKEYKKEQTDKVEIKQGD